MNTYQTATSNLTAQKRPNRRGPGSLRFRRRVLCLLGVLVLAVSPVLGQDSHPVTDQVAERVLHVAEIQLSGATRTSLATVLKYLPLKEGQAVDQAALVAAVDELRAGGLFKSVSFFTRPGERRGQLILILEVQEHGLDFRWAAGNTNLDGWYLSPAMLAYDNAFGKGGLMDLQWRIGFRHDAMLLRYMRPRIGDGRNYWGAQLGVVETDRPYFADGVEFRHVVGSVGLEGVLGRHISGHQLIEAGLKLEGVDADDHSTAYSASEDGSIVIDQKVPSEDLPQAIRSALGSDARVITYLDWQRDTRSARKRAGSPVGGMWGRVKGHSVLQGERSHAGLQADLRAFSEVPGGVLAMRLRAAWVGKSAAFYDRLYLGGMYSVRGFSTHALSSPGGDTWLCSGSLEYRSRILGDAKGTKLAGLFFLDTGASGTPDAVDPYPGLAAGAGYGLRLRVWWLDWIGVDIGFPLTERPLDMRFQATASIGWSF